MARALFAWGTPEVLNAAPWSTVSASVSGGIADPFGGTAAYTVFDTSGGVNGYVSRPVALAAGRSQTFVVFVSQSTAPTAALVLTDETVGVPRIQVDIAFPSYACTVVFGNGSASSFNAGTFGGRPWFGVVVRVDNIVAANAHALLLYPDVSGGGAGTGATVFYLRPTWTHGYDTDQLDAYPVPRPGSEKRRAASGVTDAWDAGTDEVSAGVLDWVPPDMVADPPCSGFEGDGTGLVGVGFRALLRAARRGDVIRYVRDRADCTAFADGDLAEPYDSWGGTLRDDGTRSIPFRFVGTTPLRGAL